MLDLNEWGQSELPLLNQLKKMKWEVIQNQDFPTDPKRQLRTDFNEVLLYQVLKDKIKDINVGPNGKPWLNESRLNSAIAQLERLGANKLEELAQQLLELL